MVNTNEQTLNPLILLQKREVRLMTFSKYHEHTSLLKLPNLVPFFNLLPMHDFYNNKPPSVCDNFFVHVHQMYIL